jgi:tyrosine ammonia-lyase
MDGMRPGHAAPVRLGGSPTLAEVAEVARQHRPVRLTDTVMQRTGACSEFLDRLVGESRRIYGVTTGYGPLASEQIAPAHAEQLQRNLVYHLASGVGEPFPRPVVRAIMLARLSSLSQGYSGARPATLQLLADCLNRDLVPLVPCKGTVGASGDLTPLSHIALALMGEGCAFFQGARMPAAQALRAAGLAPITLGRKEGLALVNGTSAMTGIAALNGVDADRLWQLSAALGVAFAEVMGAHRDAWTQLLGRARPHQGQVAAHEKLWRLTQDAPRLQHETLLPPRISENAIGADGVAHGQANPQDPYTLRCLPQLLGAAHDVLGFHAAIVTTELASATDNPLLFPDEEAVVHGGNFYGQHIAFASDALAPAVIKLAVWLERVVARVTDVALNRGLPAFLQGRATGLNSGFMGAQVTASALVAELRAGAGMASIQSVPTNANNQDVVSMGTIAARKVMAALDDAFRVGAIAAMVLAQAAELRGREDARGFSASTRALCRLVRGHSAFLAEDRPLSGEIERLATALRTAPFPA